MRMQPAIERRALPLFPRRALETTYAILAATWLTGAVWLLLHHFMRRQGELGIMRRPASGITLAVLFAGLIVSGYLLYYVGDESWRARVALAHWLVGLALPLSLIAHMLNRRRGESAHSR